MASPPPPEGSPTGSSVDDARDDDDAHRLAAQIEPSAIAGWPAASALPLGGWVLRFDRGFTHRANSVATLGNDEGDVEERITLVEAEYQRRGLTPSFQWTPATRPAGLARTLEARGYERRAEARVCIAEPARARASLPDSGSVRASPTADAEFASVVVAGSRSPGDGRERLDILSRVGSPRLCVVALVGQNAVAAATANLSDGLVGINLLRTERSHRRRGHARRVLSAIAEWAIEQGASLLYLGVEADNEPALALYESATFEIAYPYRFFCRPAPGPPPREPPGEGPSRP